MLLVIVDERFVGSGERGFGDGLARIDTRVQRERCRMTGLADAALAALKDAVIRVGDGRGFIVEHGHDVLVITAAHCLTKTLSGERWPPPDPASDWQDRTYPELLAPLGMPPSVWVECLFVDLIAASAVEDLPPDELTAQGPVCGPLVFVACLER